MSHELWSTSTGATLYYYLYAYPKSVAKYLFIVVQGTAFKPEPMHIYMKLEFTQLMQHNITGNCILRTAKSLQQRPQ